MKKLCKLFALLLLLALSLSLLTGCHGRLVREGSAAEDLGEEIELPAVPESFDTAKKHEISFWAKNDTNKTQIAIYQKAIQLGFCPGCGKLTSECSTLMTPLLKSISHHLNAASSAIRSPVPSMTVSRRFQRARSSREKR